MSDQAQGLRALAYQLRRESQLATYPSASQPAPSSDGSQTAVGTVPNAPYASGMALADTRLYDQPATRFQTHTDCLTPKRTQGHARVIAVTSGKGGVGKTNFSSNLALSMAATGKRVIVLDADLGLANLHVILGVNPPYNLEHVLRGERSIRDILHPAPGNIHIVAGGSGITELANLEEEDRRAFIEGLSELDTLADVIIIDTGAGLARNVLAFLCAVDEILVVTTPEPTAITDAYATIKVMSQENPSARLLLVVNMAESEVEANAVANRLQTISARFINTNLEYLGYIPQDPAVSRAVRSQSPFLLAQPNCPAAHAIRRIVADLGYCKPDPERSGGVNALLTRMQRFFGVR